VRRLRRWWPVLAALIFLAVVTLSVAVLYFAATYDGGLFEGAWRRVGDSSSSMTVSYEGDRCTIRFADERSGASQTVSVVTGYVNLEATLPPSTDPALLGGQSMDESGLPIMITAEPEHHDSVVVSSVSGPGDTTLVQWTYEPAGFFARWIPNWAAMTALVCAFLVVAVLLYGSPSSVTGGRDKAQRVLVVVVGAVLVFALALQSAWAVALARPLVAACWALFLVRVVPPQVPVIGEGLGVIFLPSRRRAFRQGLVSQDEQGERGDAMERVLHDAMDERDQSKGDHNDT